MVLQNSVAYTVEFVTLYRFLQCSIVAKKKVHNFYPNFLTFNISIFMYGCASSARLRHVHLLSRREMLLVQHVDRNQPERVQSVSFFSVWLTTESNNVGNSGLSPSFLPASFFFYVL